MAPSDSRRFSLFPSSSKSEIGIVINRHGLSPLRTHAHPTLRNTEGKQEEQCQKAFIPDSLSDTRPRVSLFLSLSFSLSLSLSLSFLLRSFLLMHTRVLGVPAFHACTRRPARRSRFYCCRKLMRSRSDTTDMGKRTIQLAARSIRFRRCVRTFAFIKRYPLRCESQSTSACYTFKQAD